MRVFLTGASGFVGAHVARALLKEGCEIHALVRPESKLWRIEDIASQMHLLQSDLLAFSELDDYLKKNQPDLAIHLAWYAVPGKYSTAPENIALLNASLRLASRLADFGCKRFIGIGTCFEYDTALGYLSESSPTRPNNLYAACKLALHTVLAQFASISQMEVAWLRLFYLYGPYEDKRRLVASIICSLLGNRPAKITGGEQIRDFLHIGDVAAAIVAASSSSLTGAVNIGSGQPVTVRDIATRIGNSLGRMELLELGALPYHKADPMFICANNDRLVEHTTWRPAYSLDQGLSDTIGWWQRRLGVG